MITQQNSISTSRNLPFGIKFSVFILNGNFLIGIVLILIGVLATSLIFNKVDFKTNYLKDEILTPTTGILKSINDPNPHAKKSTKKWEYGFTFIDDKQKVQNAISYGNLSTIKIGDTVEVLYLAEQPTIAKIKNTGFSEMEMWKFILVLLFPAVGIITIITSFKSSKRNLAILKNGNLTYAKLISKIATRKKVNKNTVYSFTFEFTDNKNNLIQSTLETHKINRIGDEEKEPIVYLISEPSKAIILDSLPKNVRKFFEKNG